MARFAAVVVFLLHSAIAQAAGEGSAAPALALPDGSGKQVAIQDLRGRVVYVDFWASWCGPCKRSFPWMEAMHRKYADRGFTVLAVNVDKKREDAQRFLERLPASFPVVFDPTGATPAAWQVKSMPSSFLVDASGRITLVENGFREERAAEVEERIRAALGASIAMTTAR